MLARAPGDVAHADVAEVKRPRQQRCPPRPAWATGQVCTATPGANAQRAGAAPAVAAASSPRGRERINTAPAGRQRGITYPFQGTIATSDGEDLWAFRYSTEGTSRSLFFSRDVRAVRQLYPDREKLSELSDDARLVVSNRSVTCPAPGSRCPRPATEWSAREMTGCGPSPCSPRRKPCDRPPRAAPRSHRPVILEEPPGTALAVQLPPRPAHLHPGRTGGQTAPSLRPSHRSPSPYHRSRLVPSAPPSASEPSPCQRLHITPIIPRPWVVPILIRRSQRLIQTPTALKPRAHQISSSASSRPIRA